MIEALTGAIATLSTAATLGVASYAASSVAVVSGAIALPAITIIVGIIFIHTGIKELRA